MRLFKQFSLLMRDVSTLDSKGGRNGETTSERGMLKCLDRREASPVSRRERVPRKSYICQANSEVAKDSKVNLCVRAG